MLEIPVSTPTANSGAGEAQRELLDQCRNCPLWQYATQAVPGEGPNSARMMLVGEQPGDQEDLAGRPFVGPARGNCSIARWRPPASSVHRCM